jgi:hypothetical protein
MIASVTAVLVELGLLQPAQIPRFHVGLTKGDTLWMDAFVERGVFFHVKIAEFVSLRDEVRVYNDAWAAFGPFMPRPLGYSVRDGWEIFVAEGVEHRPLPIRALLAASADDPLICSIFDYFAAAGRHVAAQPPQTHLPLLASLEAKFKDSPFASVLVPWCSGSGQRELEALGTVPQHGDFVSNNLGVADSRLVIFDWEDFGKVSLPGLDLCTLVVSAMEVMADGAGALAEDKGLVAERFSPLVEPACKALDIDVAQFWRLLPLYLLAFLLLKQGYATEVRQRIGAILRRVCAAQSR